MSADERDRFAIAEYDKHIQDLVAYLAATAAAGADATRASEAYMKTGIGRCPEHCPADATMAKLLSRRRFLGDIADRLALRNIHNDFDSVCSHKEGRLYSHEAQVLASSTEPCSALPPWTSPEAVR